MEPAFDLGQTTMQHSMATLVAELAAGGRPDLQPGPFFESNNLFQPSLQDETSAHDAALLADWQSLQPLDPTDLFSSDLSLYDLTYDINPSANQAADSFSWLFDQFSPGTGLAHEEETAHTSTGWGWTQAAPSAPAPSTPKVGIELHPEAFRGDNLTRDTDRTMRHL